MKIIIKLSLIKFIFTFSFVFLYFIACKDSQKNQLKAWEKKHSSSHQESLDQLARITFHHSYRDSKWDPNSKTLYIEYGGSSALTFSNSSQYVPMTKLDLARKIVRTYLYAQKDGVENLRVSLVKPFYVKDIPEEEPEIQEFEVFRVRLTKTIWESLPNKENLDVFEVDEFDYPQGNFFQALEWVTQNWEEELNEFARIELK